MPCFSHVLRNTRLDRLDIAGTEASRRPLVFGSGESRANLRSNVSQSVAKVLSPTGPWSVETGAWVLIFLSRGALSTAAAAMTGGGVAVEGWERKTLRPN